MSKNFYVTSPIYYVNDVPHIGHAYTSIACDALARFKKIQGFNSYFLTGTDEHGQKVEKSAKNNGKDPQEFCDEVSKSFQNLAKDLQLSNNDFIRTTQNRHKKYAQEFWTKLQEKGFIYKDIYEGWYAVRDEAFYNEDELIDGKAPTGAEVEWQKEESYFFKLSAFEDKLLALYEAVPDFISPKSRYNEVVSFVKSGLRDLSISRTSFDWGVKVPNDEKHVMYVWLDALTNYLSALEGDKYQNFWENGTPTHIVGKDILRFHAIYWPAFLMAAELPLPYQIYAHGWWTNEGQKISKSVGNVIAPSKEIDWLKSFGIEDEAALDYFKYFLLREVPFGNDGDYSRENFATRINAELANNIGNLAQRSLSMIWKNNDGNIVDISNYEEGQNLLNEGEKSLKIFQEKMEKLAFDQAIGEILIHSSKCNEFINEKAPWKLKKAEKYDEMNQVLSTIASNLKLIAILLQPFSTNLSNKLLEVLNIDNSQRNLDSTIKLHPTHKIKEPKALFPRLEARK